MLVESASNDRTKHVFLRYVMYSYKIENKNVIKICFLICIIKILLPTARGKIINERELSHRLYLIKTLIILLKPVFNY